MTDKRCNMDANIMEKTVLTEKKNRSFRKILLSLVTAAAAMLIALGVFTFFGDQTTSFLERGGAGAILGHETMVAEAAGDGYYNIANPDSYFGLTNYAKDAYASSNNFSNTLSISSLSQSYTGAYCAFATYDGGSINSISTSSVGFEEAWGAAGSATDNFRVLFIRSCSLSSQMTEAIKNGSLKSVTISFVVTAVAGDDDYNATAYAFISAGTGSATSFSSYSVVTHIGTGSQGTGTFKNNTKTLNVSATLNFTAGQNITVLRVGVYCEGYTSTYSLTSTYSHSLTLTSTSAFSFAYSAPKIRANTSANSTITAKIGASNVACINQDYSMAWGETVTLTIAASAGYYFNGWNWLYGSAQTINDGAKYNPTYSIPWYSLTYSSTMVHTYSASIAQINTTGATNASFYYQQAVKYNGTPYSYTPGGTVRYAHELTATDVQQGPALTQYGVGSNNAVNGFYILGNTGGKFYSGGALSAPTDTKPSGGSSNDYTYSVAVWNSNFQGAPLGTFSMTFKINPVNLVDVITKYGTGLETQFTNVSYSDSSNPTNSPYIYTGDPITPTLTSIFVYHQTYGSFLLTSAKDYNLTYTDNVNATVTTNVNPAMRQNARIIATTKNTNFLGATTIYFTIEQRNIGGMAQGISSATLADYYSRANIYATPNTISQGTTLVPLEYTGSQIKPVFIVIPLYDSTNGKTYNLYIYDYTDFAAGKYSPVISEYYSTFNTSSAASMFYIDAGSLGTNVSAGAGAGTLTITAGKLKGAVDENGYDIVVPEHLQNLTGSITITFDITPLSLAAGTDTYRNTSNVITETINKTISVVAAKTFNGTAEADQTATYSGLQSTIIPDYIYVTITSVYTSYNPDGTPKGAILTDTINYLLKRSDYAGALPSKTSAGLGTFTNSFTYGPNINVTYSGGVITPGASCTVTGSGNFKDTATVMFKILPKDLSATVPNDPTKRYGTYLPIADQPYTGSAITPSVTIRENYWKGSQTYTLIQGTDYTVSYSNNINVSRGARVYVQGIGNYTGNVYTTGSENAWLNFYIVAKTVVIGSNATISNLPSVTYNGQPIYPSPSNLTLNFTDGSSVNLTVGIGSGYHASIVSGTGANTIVNNGSTSQNWITIKLNGTDPAGSNRGLNASGDTDSAACFYSADSTIEVYFAILPKSLTSGDIAAGAAWPQATVTYNGLAHKWLSVTNETVYIWDNPRGNDKVLIKGADYQESTGPEGAWGDNINAGDTAGWVAFDGVGNYTGTIKIYFKIYPQSLSAGNGEMTISLSTTQDNLGNPLNYDSTNGGYYFTGAEIRPAVTSVLFGPEAKAIAANTDYTVSYKTASQDNTNVLKGIAVTINGTGNYTGSRTFSYSIVPTSQSVTLIALLGNAHSAANPGLAPEALATDRAKTYYSDYQININTNNTLQVTGLTTAIYPTPRRLTFKCYNINSSITSLVTSITYNSCTLVEIEGVWYSKTVATIALSGNVGIFRIVAEQYDREGVTTLHGLDQAKLNGADYFNEGNYYNYSAQPADPTYRVYVKRSDSSSLSSIVKVFGNPNFTVNPGLASYNAYKNDPQYAFSLLSTDASVLKLTLGSNSGTRVAEVGNANMSYDEIAGYTQKSLVELHLTTPGYIDYTDDTKAYMPYSATVSVTVYPRKLTISFAPKTVVYGDTNVEFVLTYTSNSIALTQALTPDDGAYGLVYPSRTVEADSIVTGIEVDYNAGTYYNVKSDGLPYVLNVVRNMNYTEGADFDNYVITYAPNNFTITKASLEAYVSGTPVNYIYKVYGSDNPAFYSVGYNGWQLSDNEYNVSSGGYDWVAPTLDYATAGVNALSPVGSYTVYLTGGSTRNYTIAPVQVTLVVEKASPVITLETATYYFDNTRHSASAATALPVVEGATQPVGTFSYRYQEENSSTDSSLAPLAAGRYYVIVNFTVTQEGNYKTSTAVFEDCKLIINKTQPNYSISHYSIEFSGSPLPFDAFGSTMSVSGVGGASIKTTALTFMWRSRSDTEPSSLLFAEQPVDDPEAVYGVYKWIGADSIVTWAATNSFVSSPMPSQKGDYDLIVVYEALADDNYTSFALLITNIVEITSGIVTINATQRTVNYSGQSISFPLANVSLSAIENGEQVTVSKTGIDPATGLSVNLITIKYLVNGVFTTTAPTAAGSYTIQIDYIGKTVDPDNTYANNRRQVDNALIINKYNLSTNSSFGIDVAASTIGSLGGGYRMVTYSGTEYAFTAEAGLFLTGLNGETPSGTLTVTYKKQGSTRALSGATDAGTYDVTVAYVENPMGDNYTATFERTYEGVIVVNKAPVIFLPSSNNYTIYSFPFTGTPKTVAVTAKGTYENMPAPQGTIVYEYKLSNLATDYSSALVPTNAGRYSVRVTYMPTFDDNYGMVNEGVYCQDEYFNLIEITPVKPTITISAATFAYGDPILPVYTIRGAAGDPAGPILSAEDLYDEYGELIRYKTVRITYTQNGVQIARPTNSGTYDVKIEFLPCDDEVNYISASATKYGAVVINFVKLSMALPTKTVTYNGSVHSFAAYDVIVTNMQEGVSPQGTYTFQYAPTGTESWSSISPKAVGVYDVRVQYAQNASGDAYSSAVSVFTGALVINKLEIQVIPIYGQGKNYDGYAVSGAAAAYCYSYAINGYTYYVYSTVRGLGTDELIDIAEAYYAAEDGYVYTIFVGSYEAWRDYELLDLRVTEGFFTDDVGTAVTVDYSSFAETTGLQEYGDYIIDLSTSLARYRRNADNLSVSYGAVSGNFFSIANSEGFVQVYEINAANIRFTAGSTTLGTYTLAIGGVNTTVTVNLATKKVTYAGKSYALYNSAAVITYNDASGLVVNQYIDLNSLSGITEEGGYYKASDGYVYELNFAAGTAARRFPVTLTKAETVYQNNDGETAVAEIELGALSELYENLTGFGRYQADGYTFIVDLASLKIWKQLYYKATSTSTIATFSYPQAGGTRTVRLAVADYQATSDPDVFTVTGDDGIVYAIDISNMTVRVLANKGAFDIQNSRITIGAEKVTVGDPGKLLYTLRNGSGSALRLVSLFGLFYTVSAPALINGNVWSGGIALSGANAGAYTIGAGNLKAGDNYNVVFTSGVKYSIAKIAVSVVFTASDSVYDGREKTVGYTVSGVIAGETVRMEAVYEGDRTNATLSGESGYRVKLSLIDSENYYLENATPGGYVISGYYKIELAEMEEPTFEGAESVVKGEDGVYRVVLNTEVYSGLAHSTALSGLPEGAVVTYNGKTTAPSYTEAGTYLVTVRVTRANRYPIEIEISLTIRKKQLNVQPTVGKSKLYYGDSLSDVVLILNPAIAALGTVVLDEGQTLSPTVSTYSWHFVPASADFYTKYEGTAESQFLIAGTVNITVLKALPVIGAISGNLTQSESKLAALEASIIGQGNEKLAGATIYYLSASGEKLTSLPTAPGQYTVVVSYAGNELYEGIEYRTTLVIHEEQDYKWLWMGLAAFVALGLISSIFFTMRKRPHYN